MHSRSVHVCTDERLSECKRLDIAATILIACAVPTLAVVLGPSRLGAQDAVMRSQVVSQSESVLISGLVRGPDEQPIPGAVVVVYAGRPPRTATMPADSTRADDRGIYRVRLPAADVYTIYVTALGFKPAERIVARRDSLVVAGLQLERIATSLQTVQVKGRRPPRRPPIAEFGTADIGGLQAIVSNTSTIPPSEAGNLAAIAATVPGVTPIAATDGGVRGFSVLGLAPAQNNVTLNGLSFAGGQIPSAAFTLPRIVTTSFDPTVGGFSGAQLALTMYPGSNFTFGNLTVQYDDPLFQLTDQAARQLGQRFRNVQVSAARTGPLIFDKLFYDVAVQGGYRRSDGLSTLADATPGALSLVGVSPSTAGQFQRALDSLGLPTSGNALGSAFHDSATKNAALLARFDILPTATRGLNVTVNGAWTETDPALLSPTSVTSRAARTSTANGGVQTEFARYIADRFLSRTRSGVSGIVTNGRPSFLLPDGRVLANSTLPDGSTGFATLLFGSAGTLPRRASSWTWETTHETSWFTPGSRHRPKVSAAYRLDGFSNDQAPDRYGAFSFVSLNDLTAGRPASFTRTLRGGQYTGYASSGSLALGDLWRLTDRFSVQYGTRIEANWYGTRARYNSAVDSLFGVRTDWAPAIVRASPRLGFSWSYGHRRTGIGGAANTPLGTLSGGVGVFRGLLAPTLVGPAINSPGLADVFQRVVCVGPAAPAPDWAAYLRDAGTIPASCIPVAQTSFADTAPPVTVLMRGFEAPESRRANLAWSGAVLGVRLSVSGLYSLTTHQPSTVDLNFNGIGPQFTIGTEDGRVVFADPSQIDPASGSVSPTAARRSFRFARVAGLTSDMRAQSRQLTLTLSPASSGFFFSRRWSIGYALTRSTDEVRGFDAAAFGDPRRVDRAPSAYDVRHSFSGSLAWQFGENVFVTAGGQLRSGLPFTPLVAGDVNGDGLVNDRAFIFDPASVTDTAFGNGIRNLLAGSPSDVRNCLLRQLGHVAGRNSCRGPWTATLSAGVSVNGALVRLPDRSRVMLTFSNPLAAVDQLLHGERGLRGWGQNAYPDPVLFAVRGFDPATRQFRYTVNSQFGDTRPGRTNVRTPFQVTIGVSLPVGAPQARQVLDQVLAAGRTRGGTRLSAVQIKARYVQTAPNPMRTLLQAKDTLLLTQDQQTRLAQINGQYAAALDSVWGPVAEYLSLLDDRFRTRDAIPRLREAQSKAYDALEVAARDVRSVLTPEQVELLSTDVRALLDEKTLQLTRKSELRFYY